MLVRLVLLLVLTASGCAPSVDPIVPEAELSVIAAGQPYGGVAWVGDDSIALNISGPEPRIVLVQASGEPIRDVTLPEPPMCRIPEIIGLSVAPAGGLGFADTCLTRPGPFEFHALDLANGDADRSAGFGIGLPLSSTWAADGSVVYSTGDAICTTLYRRANVNAPIDLVVEVDGIQLAVGQDLTDTPDGCSIGGRAGYPSFSADGKSLAFLASSDGDTPAGQGLGDRPWSLFVVRDDQPIKVIDELRHPGDLVLNSSGDHALFAGQIGGRRGVWCIDIDNASTVLISDVDVFDISIRPSGGSAAAIVSPVVGSDSVDTHVVVINGLHGC